MTTVEATTAMLETMPRAEQLKVQRFTERLFMKRDTKNPFQPLSKKQILRGLKKSKAQAKAGKVKDADVVLKELRAEFGL